MTPFSSVVEGFLSEYRDQETTYAQLANIAKWVFDSRAKASTVNPAPICTARGKTHESLRRKLATRDKRANEGHGYTNTTEIYKDVSDLAGIRILLYFPEQRDEVDSIISAAFENVLQKRDSDTYNAKMYRVHVKKEDLGDLDLRGEANVVEVQVVSLLMHAWAEVEHRSYKGLIDSSPEEKEVLCRLKEVALEGEDLLGKLHSLYDDRSKT